MFINNIIIKKTEFYINENKKTEENYDDGRLSGKYLEWYENGKLKSEKLYKEGIATKVTEWLENGDLKKNTIYIDKTNH